MTAERDAVAATASLDQGFGMVADTALMMAAQFDDLDSTEASRQLLAQLYAVGIPPEAAALGVAVLAIRLRRSRIEVDADG